MKQITSQQWASFLGIWDFILTPFYVAIAYFIINRIRDRYYPQGHPWRRYFTNGFNVKIFGAIFISLIYQYYYSGGDTSAYFYHAKVINSAANESFTTWFRLLLGIPKRYDSEVIEYTSQMIWYGNTSTYFVSSIIAFLNIFTFNTFIPTAIITALISYSGNWALFRTFAKQYPVYANNIALATLFIPSTFVWGSGIFKDTFCMLGLGWFTYAVFEIFMERKLSIKQILILSASFYLIYSIKVYIVLAFVPAIAFWIVFTYNRRIKNSFVRYLFVFLIIIGMAGGGAYLSAGSLTKELGDYSIENILESSEVQRNYIYNVSIRKDASAYSLGDVDPTLTGVLKKMPAAVNVALFRPYFWEARKPMVFLNSIEATLFLFFTVKVIFSVGIRKVWRSIARNPNIQFFLIFTMIFAFAVGISSYNFGALSRYRIPCLPFYALALIFIYYDNKPIENKFLSFNFS